MCLIVALFFPFLIEVCWLLYCVVYSLCKITQLEKQDNQKCIFATDGILEQNSVRRTFKCVATVTCLIMAVPYWCFCGVQWLFIHVIYIKCLGFWLERKDSWEKKFRPSQWWPILDLALVYTVSFNTEFYGRKDAQSWGLCISLHLNRLDNPGLKLAVWAGELTRPWVGKENNELNSKGSPLLSTNSTRWWPTGRVSHGSSPCHGVSKSI